MSYSSVYFHRRKNLIHYWEYENNKKVHKTAPPPLFFYINDDEGEFRTTYGTRARKIECSNWSDFRQKREDYKRMGFKLYESDVPIETKFIVEEYLGQELKIPDLDIHFFDIEVHSDDGFPSPEEADYPIVVITVWSTKHKKFFIFAERDFDGSFMDDLDEDYEKFIFDTEEALLKSYIKWVYNEHPDILTGWFSNFYDIPYILNRTKNILGEKWQRRISPLGFIKEREVRISETKTELRYDIAGIACLDMLEIYKNYTFSDRENYRLGYITQVELGEEVTKNEYEGSIAEFYHNDWQGYVEYNIQDTRLLCQLEEKLGYIKMLVNFCYGCRVPFEYYQKTTKVLDGAFISELTKEGVVLPDINRDLTDLSYPGGFVMDPDRGIHDWVVSYDATSLYPSIMMGWNISPETKVAVFNKAKVENIYNCYMGEPYEKSTIIWDDKEWNLQEFCHHIDSTLGMKVVNENGGFHRIANGNEVENVMRCLSGRSYDNLEFAWNDEVIDVEEAVRRIKKENYTLAYNGVVYDQNKQGVIPRFVENWFNQRKRFKKKMIDAEKDAEKYKKLDNKDKANEADSDAKFFNLIQLNYKILINSVYGYLGTVYSRFYDFDNAVAVTISGQLITRTVANSLNGYFSKKWSQSKFANSLSKNIQKIEIESEDGEKLELQKTDSIIVIRNGQRQKVLAENLKSGDEIIKVSSLP